MKSQPAEIVASFLVLRNLAIRPDAGPRSEWQVFKRFSPAKPDDVIVCYNEEPDIQGKTSDGKTLIKPRVMIRVRSTKDDSAYQKCVDIINALSLAKRVPLVCFVDNDDNREAVLLKSVTIINGPRDWLPQEESNRLTTFTFSVQLTASGVT
jgi:hypothetical protein